MTADPDRVGSIQTSRSGSWPFLLTPPPLFPPPDRETEVLEVVVGFDVSGAAEGVTKSLDGAFELSRALRDEGSRLAVSLEWVGVSSESCASDLGEFAISQSKGPCAALTSSAPKRIRVVALSVWAAFFWSSPAEIWMGPENPAAAPNRRSANLKFNFRFLPLV